MEYTKNVLILGAGFAGIYTAVHLSKKLRGDSGISIRLVDVKESHLFKPMLHEVACGSVDPSHIIQPIYIINRKRSFNFIQGVVQSIDVDNRVVGICEECIRCVESASSCHSVLRLHTAKEQQRRVFSVPLD